MVDDATIFQAMLRTRENGGLICMHAENGGVIDTLVKRALAEGHTEPKWHALTRPMSAEAEATPKGHRSRGNGGRARLHRASLRRRRDGRGPPRPRAGSSGIRRNLPSVPLPLLRRLREARVRGREVRDVAAAPTQGKRGAALERAQDRRPPSGLDAITAASA